MLYDLLRILICALGAYGLYAALRGAFFRVTSGRARSSPGVHVGLGYSVDEIGEELDALRIGAEAGCGEFPVLLVDCPLRREALEELSGLDADIYLLYEDENEKGTNRTIFYGEGKGQHFRER